MQTANPGLLLAVTVHAQQAEYKTADENVDAGFRADIEVAHTYANHALGIAYIQTGNNVGAMQQYHTLLNLSPDLAEDLLRQIPQ